MNLFTEFRKLFEKVEVVLERCEPRMYLILREDLTFKYIQGAHALAQMAIQQPSAFAAWGNSYLICLSVFNGLALQEVFSKLTNDYTIDVIDVFAEAFYEPDLQSSLPTAIAIYENGDGDVMRALKRYKLATK